MKYILIYKKEKPQHFQSHKYYFIILLSSVAVIRFFFNLNPIAYLLTVRETSKLSKYERQSNQSESLTEIYYSTETSPWRRPLRRLLPSTLHTH